MCWAEREVPFDPAKTGVSARELHPTSVSELLPRLIGRGKAVELREQLMAEAKARGQALGPCVRDLLQRQIGGDAPAAGSAEAPTADTLA